MSFGVGDNAAAKNHKGKGKFVNPVADAFDPHIVTHTAFTIYGYVL